MDSTNHPFFFLLAFKAIPVMKVAKKEETFLVKLNKHNRLDFKGLIPSKVCWIVRQTLVSNILWCHHWQTRKLARNGIQMTPRAAVPCCWLFTWQSMWQNSPVCDWLLHSPCSWANILSASLWGLILDFDISKLVLSYNAALWAPIPVTHQFPRQMHLEQLFEHCFEQCPPTSCSPAWWAGPKTRGHAHSTLKLQGELRKGFGDAAALLLPQIIHCMLPLLTIACIRGNVKQMKFQLSSPTSQTKAATTIPCEYSTAVPQKKTTSRLQPSAFHGWCHLSREM